MSGFPQERNWSMPTWPAPWGIQMQPPPGIVYPAPASPEAEAAQRSLERVTVDVAREVVWNAQVSPSQDPPYRGQPIAAERRVVVGPIPGNAAALAAAVALAAAEAPFSGGLPLLIPPTVASYVTVLAFTVPRSGRATIRQAGMGAPAATKDALRWRVLSGGLPLTFGIDQGGLWPRASADDLLDTFSIPMGGQLVELQVRNLDPNAGYLVEARLSGWLFPTLQQDDNVRSIFQTNGLDTNGRFSRSAFCPPPFPPSMASPAPPPCPPCGPPCGP
jgi:hypothetical protein